MNRIKISPLASDTLCEPRPSSQISGFETRTQICRTANDDFSLFVPMHYESRYAYPLIVWLHGDGHDSSQIQQVMLDMSMRNYVAIAPTSVIGSENTGFSWEQETDSIEAAHDSVSHVIDEAQARFNIASHRIFLAGTGSGGTMAFRLAFERPEIFAGVLSINGPIPGQVPLRDWSRCRDMPVFWAHGRYSTDFNEDQLCQQLRLLHIAGFSVTLRQYPQTNLLCPKTMSDMNHWVMEMINTTITDRHPK